MAREPGNPLLRRGLQMALSRLSHNQDPGCDETLKAGFPAFFVCGGLLARFCLSVDTFAP